MLFLAIIMAIFSLGIVSAALVTDTDITSTLKQVSITSAGDLYAYEVDFKVDSGGVSSVDFAGFLGGSTASGFTENDGHAFIYESRLDNTQTGVTGSGILFDMAYGGDVTLKAVLEYDKFGTTVYTTYNPDGTVAAVAGGDSGTGAKIISGDILTDPEELSVNVVIGEGIRRELTVINNEANDIFLTLSTSNLGNVVSFDKTTLTIPAGGSETITITILAEDTEFFAGKIILRKGRTVVREVNVLINIRSENFLFDASVLLSPEFKRILFGTNLVSTIDLLQVGPNEKVDVVATYTIADFAGTIFVDESETFSVLGQRQVLKEFFTEDLPPGDYVLSLEILYPGAFAVSSTQFVIYEEEGAFSGFENTTALLIGAGIVIVAIIVAIIWAMFGRKAYRVKGKKKK